MIVGRVVVPEHASYPTLTEEQTSSEIEMSQHQLHLDQVDQDERLTCIVMTCRQEDVKEEK